MQEIIELAVDALPEYPAEDAEACARMAVEAIAMRRWPFDEPSDEERHEYYHKVLWTVVKATRFLLEKEGADGQTSHEENGIRRSYAHVGPLDVPVALIANVVPKCGVPR